MKRTVPFGANSLSASRSDGETGTPLFFTTPRNFTNPKFHKNRTDGEMFWVIKNGSAGTGMVPPIGTAITEEEAPIPVFLSPRRMLLIVFVALPFARAYLATDLTSGKCGRVNVRISHTGAYRPYQLI